MCERHGVPLLAAALQFPLRHPAVACVLAGARSAAELEEDVRLSARPLPGAMWDELCAEGLIDPMPSPAAFSS